MKLRIALYLHISIASYLTFHQIMWHNKKINGHGKLQAAVFSTSKETKFEFDTISIISERHWKNTFNFSEIVNKLRVEARNSIAN